MRNVIRLLFATLSTILILAILFLTTKDYKFLETTKPSINVFVWGDIFPIELEKQFERDTGIKLNLHFFNSNEELLSKLRNTKGKGYDILFPSDYTVKILAEEGYIKPLEKERLSFYKDIDPMLLNRDYDQDNFYSIPFVWEATIIAVDTDTLSIESPPSLDLLFPSKSPPYKLLMTPDPVEALYFASFALFGDKKSLTHEEKRLAQNLLEKQSFSVEAYSEHLRTKYLLTTKNSPLAVTKTPTYLDIAETNPNIKAILPKEATFASIENITISSRCKNEEAAYQFIEYINQPSVLKSVIEEGPIFIARRDLTGILDPSAPYADLYQKLFEEIHERDDLVFFSYLISPEELQEVWVNSKIGK